MEGASEIASIFGGDETKASRIPEDLRPILLERWSKLRKELDSSRPDMSGPSSTETSGAAVQDPIARTTELEAENESLKSQLASKNEENENLARQVEDMHSSYSLARQKSVNLEESSDKLNTEVNQLRRDKESLTNEVEEYRTLAERRREEIEALHVDFKRLTEQLAEANAAKCEALVRSEDIAAKEIALKHKESRLEQERDLFEERMDALSEDLRHAHDTASIARRDLSAKIAQLEGDLSHKNETIRILEGREEALIADKDSLQGRINDLIERLKEARDAKSNLEEGFRQEVRAQTRLAELHQKQASDAEEKSQKLTAAITDLQRLLREAGERYGKLEDHFEQEKVEHKEEVKRRNDAIRILRKELTDANQLIEDLKHKGMTDEGIAALSPAAAAASKLIKTGMSLTQVYSQLVSCQEELLAAEDEKRRLNTYLEQILSDIEQRAPALKRQRDEYERAVTTVNQLTQQIEDLKESNRDDSEAVGTLRRKLETSVRDNDRMSKQNKDLSQQVATLLREVEAARFGRRTTRADSSGSGDMLDADGAISERLVSFKDVQELQTRNAELLMVIREVTAKQEASEAKLVEERTADLKTELDSVKEQLEQLTEARRRQETLVENIVHQRDMYKTMVESQGETNASMVTSTPSSTPMVKSAKSPQIHSQAEVRAAKAEAALEEVKKDFDTYREEKCAHEKMLSETLESTRTELSESRAKTMKLAANEEWNTERFKIAQNNNATYKKEIGFLEEKNNNLNALVAKHENSIQAMHSELIKSNTDVARLTNQYERAKHDVNLLKNAQSRLEKERDILTRQTSGSAMIAENLKLVQLKLDQADSEARMRLQNQNEDLTKEVNLLRKKLETAQESYHKSVQAWEAAELDLRSKNDTLKESEAKAKSQVDELNNSIEEVRHQLKISQEKLTLVQAGSSSGSGMVDSEKVVDLQSQVNALKNETLKLKEHLSKARQATNQYKEIADASEKQVVDSNEIYKQMKAKYEELQTAGNAKEKALEVRIKNLEAAKTELEKEASEGQHKRTRGAASVQQLEVSIEHLKEQLNLAHERNKQINLELQQQLSQAQELQEKYERELMEHAATATTLKEHRSAIKINDVQITELEQAKAAAEANLKEIKDDAKATETTLRAEYKSLQDQFANVENQNASLHDQLKNLSTQMASIHDTGTAASGDTSMNKSFAEEDAKSTEQLMEIIKYLRTEKSILTGKVEVSKAESIRLKAQLESIQHQYSETQNALHAAEQKANQEVLPSSKYSQLLEKVQTIPALNDSNRFLRDERDQLKSKLELNEKLLKEYETKLTPLREQIVKFQEELDKEKAENLTLKTDGQRWRQRVNQLIEKHQKISPEELLKAQNENVLLKKKVSELTNEKNTQARNTQVMMNKNKNFEAELATKTQESTKINQELMTAKNANQQLTSRLNLATKKSQETENSLKQLSSERDNLNSELQKHKNEMTTLNSKHVELTTANQKTTEELTKIKGELVTKDKQLETTKTQTDKLKQLGRTLKSKNEQLNQEVNSLKETNQKLTEAAANAGDQSSTSQGPPLAEAEELIAQSAAKIEELETKVKELEKDKESSETKSKTTEETLSKYKDQTREILRKAKEKYTESITEKKAVEEKLKAAEEKVKTLEESGSASAASTSGAAEEAGLRTRALEAQLANEKVEREKLVESFNQEREKYKEQIKKMETQKTQEQQSPQTSETVTGKVKPTVSSAPSTARVKSQPQAQVHPTYQRVEPIRPTTMRTTQPRTAAVPAMRQIAAPTAVASVSPSSASLNPSAPEFVPTRTPPTEQPGAAVDATPTTSGAPVTAPTTTPVAVPAAQAAPTVEVTPATSVAPVSTPVSSGAPISTPAISSAPISTPVATPGPSSSTPSSSSVSAPAAPLAKVQPRQSADESMPSTSAMPAAVQPGPSSMTASVAPTMKRSRDEDPEEDTAKKARTATTTTASEQDQAGESPVYTPVQEPTAQDEDDDCVVILSSDDENPQEESDAGGGEADFDEEAVDEEIESEADEGEFDEEGDQDSSLVIMQPIEDYGEEIVDDDDDNDDEPLGQDPEFAVEPVSETGPAGGSETVDIVEVDSDDDNDYLEDDPSPSQAEESGGAVVPQMGEAGSSRVDDSGAGGSSEATTSHQTGQFEDAGDDSVVPSTPKLSGSGSETAATSQVPTFMFQSTANPEVGTSSTGAATASGTTFGSLAAQASSSTSGQSGVKGASQEGIDRTSVDILQFAGGSTAAPSSASAPTGFAALAQMAPNKPLFGGTPAPSPFSGAASTSPFAGSGAPVFGGPASIGKPAASSTSPGTSSSTGGLFSKSPSQQITAPAAETKPEETGSNPESAQTPTPEPVGQPIEVVASETSRPRIDRGPRITRTPIVWGNTGSSASATGSGSGGTQTTAAPSAPQQRGRGGRGSTARRSRPGRGGAGMSRGVTPP